ncbi:uncharacterized protein LOC142320268 [Lycorma delicatula]|uniref:uncharacterized protein LOC142320268 n=1 Tax=Lycorma delicatula TaxID=130591 RepID=UPI003F513EA4
MIFDYSFSYQRNKILRQKLKIMSLIDRFSKMFMAFENFFIFNNKDNWCIGITETDIRDLFKVAYSLEQFCIELEGKKLSEVFSEKLTDYFKGQGCISCPKFDVFKKACDVLLSKFLTDCRLTDSMVKLSVQQYHNYCGENRFITVTEELIHTRQAYLELSKFVEASCDPADIEARFIYKSWCNRLNFKSGNSLSLDESVMEILQSDVKTIKIVFLMLCFADENENEFSKIIKNCIISKLVSQVSLENIQIWKCFVQLPIENVKSILTEFPELLNSLFDVVTKTSENFYCEYGENRMQWFQKVPNSLSYPEILSMFTLLYNVGDVVKVRVENYFNSKKSSERYLFFEDIESVILINVNSGKTNKTE